MGYSWNFHGKYASGKKVPDLFLNAIAIMLFFVGYNLVFYNHSNQKILPLQNYMEGFFDVLTP
jgi:hypothetical protein